MTNIDKARAPYFASSVHVVIADCWHVVDQHVGISCTRTSIAPSSKLLGFSACGVMVNSENRMIIEMKCWTYIIDLNITKH